MSITEFAAAKINLTLAVKGRRPDGYHALESLVAFALDAGDRLTLWPGAGLTLETAGPEACHIDGPNLIVTVVEAVLRERPGLVAGRFHLEKQLPVASGIGGGSADAAAAMRALARANGILDAEACFAGIAAGFGADIPVCIGTLACAQPSRAAFMSGIGERVWRPRASLVPSGLAAVLANPRVPVPTAAVFRSLAAPPLEVEPGPKLPPHFGSIDACLAYIAANPNDLEAPALRVAPVIADVLAAIGELPRCRLARMSGSGATCFGLFSDFTAADAAAHQLRARHSDWWVAATRLA